MLEDKVRSGRHHSSSRLLGDGLQHDAYNRYINADGRLTDVFRTELSLIGQQEAQKLEDQLQDLQPPEADFVGIKRRFAAYVSLTAKDTARQTLCFRVRTNNGANSLHSARSVVVLLISTTWRRPRTISRRT